MTAPSEPEPEPELKPEPPEDNSAGSGDNEDLNQFSGVMAGIAVVTAVTAASS